jgi:NADH dehydrogenase/NADH:ubiquinone oxidoreductase subunit G
LKKINGAYCYNSQTLKTKHHFLRANFKELFWQRIFRALLGALTLKSFPHEARGWEVKNFDCVDPTDSYGSETQVYVNRRRILIIEPSFELFTYNNWLSDKGRHIFDGAYKVWEEPVDYYKNFIRSVSANIYHRIIKKCYFLEHFFNSFFAKNFLTIVFGHVGIETINLLYTLCQRYSFTKLTNVIKPVVNDLETVFQLNAVSDWTKLKESDLCMLVGTNTRLESFRLNLLLRQRIMKGGFTCVLFSSLVDLTFTTLLENSEIRSVKALTVGVHRFCQTLTETKNPLIVYNNDLLKSNYGEPLIDVFKKLSDFAVCGLKQNRLNMLNSALSEGGGYSITKVDEFSFKALTTSSIFYFLHVNLIINPYVKQAIEAQLLKLHLKKRYRKAQILDQNYMHKINRKFSLNAKSYYYAPTRTFYETDDTYLNANGVLKRSARLFLTKNILTTWQTVLTLIRYLNKQIKPLNFKSLHGLTLNIKGYCNFKNFTHLQSYVTQNLSSANYHINFKSSTVFFKFTEKFKKVHVKLKYHKLKLWLEDFFTGGRDEYSRNSAVLSECSSILRDESKNF